MSHKIRKEKEILDEPQVTSTQPLLAIELGNISRDLKTDLLDEESSDHNAEFPMRGLTNYLDPKIEESVLTEKNLTALRDKYDIPDEYEMLMPG